MENEFEFYAETNGLEEVIESIIENLPAKSIFTMQEGNGYHIFVEC